MLKLAKSATNEQTKFAKPEDQFEIIHPIPALRDWYIAKPSESVITRVELSMFKLAPDYGCRQGWLRPLSPNCPEEAGLTSREVIAQLLPATKEVPRRFQRMFDFLEGKVGLELRARCGASPENYVKPAFEILAPEVTPACLSPILEAALPDNPATGNRLYSMKLANRLLLEVPLPQFTGKGALTATDFIAGQLLETDSQGVPLCRGVLAKRLLDLLAVNKPPRTTEVFNAVRRYQRLDLVNWQMENEAADAAFFALFT